VIQHRSTRKALLVLGLAAFLVSAPGCLFSPESKGNGGGQDLREPPRDSPENAIALYKFVWEQGRLESYAELLHSAYEYVPQEADADDFPWIPPGAAWVRTDELGMAANMFNPEFVSNETGETVDSITMELDITNERIVGDEVELTTNADIQVLWTASSGAYSRVRFIFTVVEDPDDPGLWQIIRQVELPEF